MQVNWDKRELMNAMCVYGGGEEHGSKDGINKKIGGAHLELGNHGGRSSWFILYSILQKCNTIIEINFVQPF